MEKILNRLRAEIFVLVSIMIESVDGGLYNQIFDIFYNIYPTTTMPTVPTVPASATAVHTRSMNPQEDNDRKRKANETDSVSTESLSRRKSQKTQRRSFFIMWDIALEIPTALKKLQKFRLGISQEQFSPTLLYWMCNN